MLKEFRDFVLRGNVIDLAVAVVIGAAFTTVVNALVSGLLTPMIAAVVGEPSFQTLSFEVNGAMFAYGAVLDALITFLLVAAAVFFVVVKPMNVIMDRLRPEPPVGRPTRECPECLSSIPEAASRCAFCTATVAGPAAGAAQP